MTTTKLKTKFFVFFFLGSESICAHEATQHAISQKKNNNNKNTTKKQENDVKSQYNEASMEYYCEKHCNFEDSHEFEEIGRITFNSMSLEDEDRPSDFLEIWLDNRFQCHCYILQNSASTLQKKGQPKDHPHMQATASKKYIFTNLNNNIRLVFEENKQSDASKKEYFHVGGNYTNCAIFLNNMFFCQFFLLKIHVFCAYPCVLRLCVCVVILFLLYSCYMCWRRRSRLRKCSDHCKGS